MKYDDEIYIYYSEVIFLVFFYLKLINFSSRYSHSYNTNSNFSNFHYL